MTPHKNTSSLGVYGQEKEMTDFIVKKLPTVAGVLITLAFLVAMFGLFQGITTFTERIAEYDSQYAEVTGQK